MSGEEKVIAGKDAIKKFSVEHRRVYYHLSREGADMRKDNEYRSYQSKKGDAFHSEWQAFGFF